MLIAVFSDSHESPEPMIRAVETHRPELVLHLGDGERDCITLQKHFPELEIFRVTGNCDPVASRTEPRRRTEREGVRIYLAHGHEPNVKTDPEAFKAAARKKPVDLALFGHTHIPCLREKDGILLLNPVTAGSGDKLTAAVLRIDEKGFRGEIFDI